MVKDEIGRLIADAMRNRENDKLEVYRLVKAELTKAEKDGIILDEAAEAKLLLKMVSQREDSISQYEKAGRNDLVESESRELVILRTLCPETPSDEDIEKETLMVIEEFLSLDNGGLSMKLMKPILEKVQLKYPTANGKVVSRTLNNYIKLK